MEFFVTQALNYHHKIGRKRDSYNLSNKISWRQNIALQQNLQNISY